jgi:hemin uptake protein HemP
MEYSNTILRIPFLRLSQQGSRKPAPTFQPVSQSCVSSAVLFGGASEIAIRHEGTNYRLRITKQDKLLLTK